ncbi:hypothetical protein EYV94_28005 [Puteibacter caeruleilacunae]|nr:hypothetical protein EYV94_28005 [Puteibacter caeruleilacunae]
MNKKKIRILRWIVTIIGGIIFFWYHTKDAPTFMDYQLMEYRDMRERSLNGLVTDKKIDVQNHSRPTIIIQQNESKIELDMLRDRSNFYNYVNIGDSITKPHGSIEIHVFSSKKDTLIRLDYLVTD